MACVEVLVVVDRVWVAVLVIVVVRVVDVAEEVAEDDEGAPAGDGKEAELGAAVEVEVGVVEVEVDVAVVVEVELGVVEVELDVADVVVVVAVVVVAAPTPLVVVVALVELELEVCRVFRHTSPDTTPTVACLIGFSPCLRPFRKQVSVSPTMSGIFPQVQTPHFASSWHFWRQSAALVMWPSSISGAQVQ